MKINAFKVNQYSNNGKKYNIYVTKISIFDLKDFVYVKTVKDYTDKEGEFVTDTVFGKQSFDNYTVAAITDDSNKKNIDDIKEVQREKKDLKLREIGNYLKDQAGIFPTSILLGNKSKNLINIGNELNGISVIEINEELKGKEGFFIIDGQHRVFGLLKFMLDKLLLISKEKNLDLIKIEEKTIKKSGENNLDPIVNKINIILNELTDDIVNNFIKENNFDLATVIINELTEDKMAVLFADINSNATKLDSNLETWIYGHKTEDKKLLRIFVNIGEKLNSNKHSPLYGRFKIPTNLTPNKFSKIGIKAFCDNSLKLLNIHEKRVIDKNLTKPFNLLFDKLVNYEEEMSYETEQFMINGLTVVYFSSFFNAKKVYGEENFNKINFNFLNTNNLGLYLYIIKYVFLKLYSKNNENFIDLFYSNDILKQIEQIFIDEINKPLLTTYEKYNYFEKGTLGGSSGSKEAEIVLFFKKELYGLQEIEVKKLARSEILKKEKELI